jgi:hypothetical protein
MELDSWFSSSKTSLFETVETPVANSLQVNEDDSLVQRQALASVFEL